MAKKKYEDNEYLELLGEEKNLKKKKRVFRAKCVHISKKGHRLLNPTDVEGVFECSRCHEKVDLRSWMGADDAGERELMKHVDGVVNALQIIKYRSALDSDDASRDVVKATSNLILQLSGVPDLMSAIADGGKKKKKEKKEKRKEISIGLNIGFGGDKKKKKSKW